MSRPTIDIDLNPAINEMCYTAILVVADMMLKDLKSKQSVSDFEKRGCYDRVFIGIKYPKVIETTEKDRLMARKIADTWLDAEIVEEPPLPSPILSGSKRTARSRSPAMDRDYFCHISGRVYWE